MKEYIKFGVLLGAYLECMKPKRNSHYCMEFMINAHENLYKLYKVLNNGTYKVGRSVAFLIKKPKLREVFCAPFDARVINHLLVNRVNSYFEDEFIDHNFACRIGKGTFYGAKCLFDSIRRVSNNYTRRVDVLIVDYNNFFMSIDKTINTNLITEFIKDKFNSDDITTEFYINLFSKVLNNHPQDNCIRKNPESEWDPLPPEKSLFKADPNKGIPIGDLTSQKSGALYMDDVDHKCYDKFGDDYGRYVDDAFFVIPHTSTSIAGLKEFIKVLDDYSWRTRGLHLNINKVRIHNGTDRIKYLGMELMPSRILPIPRTINNLRSKLIKYSKLSTPTDKDLIDLRNSVNSSLGLLRQGNTYRLRKDLLNPAKYSILNYFDIINYEKINIKTMQLTICHSFWSKPCNESRYNIDANRQWKVNLYCAMLSCLYAKKHGCKVNFYGDAESIRRFQCIPYDKFIELDIPANASTNSWAQGKFYAQKMMDLGDIHIDLDVFMKGDKIYDILKSDYDCIVQGLEDQFQTELDTYKNSREYLNDIEFSDRCTTSTDLSYNVGVIGFKNQEFKNIYLNNYFNSLDPISKLLHKDGVIPDLIVEQQHLYQLAKSHGYHVKPLLGFDHLDVGQRNTKLYDDAKELNYQHVLSIYKYQQFDQIREELMSLDPKRCRLLDMLTSSIKI